jgi:hypothetical protein
VKAKEGTGQQHGQPFTHSAGGGQNPQR